MAVNLIKNGDFEGDIVTGSFLMYVAPNQWSIDYGVGPDIITSDKSRNKFAPNGATGNFVELDGSGKFGKSGANSSISQVVDTIPGQRYQLDFDWSPYPLFLSEFSQTKSELPFGTDSFTALVNGKAVFEYAGTYSTQLTSWRKQSIAFTADSDATKITFRAPESEGDYGGASIDNVILTQLPTVRGNSLYTIVDGPSWTQAEANSVKVGGHLVTINDKDENQFVYDIALASNAGLIGLYDPTGKDQWIWSSGEQTSYLNWSPEKRPYIGIEKWANILYTNAEKEYAGYWNTHQSGPGMYNSPGIAEIPFIRRGDSAYVIVQGPTWEEAEANAVALGGHLVTINDADESNWLSENMVLGGEYWTGLSDQNIDNIWVWSDGSESGFRNWNSGEPNGNNAKWNEVYASTVGRWGGRWNDRRNDNGLNGIAEIKLAPNNTPTGTPTLSGNFKVGDVITIDRTPIQDADNFTGYTPVYKYSWESSTDGTTWNKLTTTDATDENNTYTITTAEVGKQIRGVVSYVDGYGTTEILNSSASVKIEAQVKQPIIRGNSLYSLLNEPLSWSDAESESIGLGGHLVTINDANENEFLHQSFSPSSYGLWIGLTRPNDLDSWAWSNGETLDYTNWNSNEGSIPGEYMAVLGFAGKDLWDAHSPIERVKGIAEIPFIRRGDSAYVIVQGPTWEEAEANAVALGGHLVTINDAEENEWVTDLTRISNNHSAWIGFTDKKQEGQWSWSDTSASTFTSWDPGQPGNSSENYAGIVSGVNSHPQFLSWGKNKGKWHDFLNAGDNNAPRVGIAEIKLASNNAPTGTPTIAGDLKVGSTLTIDASAIQDADNFAGYTPTYKYSWESSTDGTTWNKLTTTDATDENNTYTLTTAEIGKQIRGVVSYVDRYGTTETIPTTGQRVEHLKDTTPPSIAVTSNKSSLTAGEQATLTFNLSEDSTDFTLTDINVSGGGTLSDFQGSGKNYTATFTPKPNSTTASIISVGNNAFRAPRKIDDSARVERH